MQNTENGNTAAENRWYVVWAASRTERRLEKVLSRELSEPLGGERCWIPTRIEKRKAKSGKGEERVEKLLFPGYVFVYTGRPGELHAVLKDRRVSDYLKILRSGDGYAPITGEEETVLRRLTGKTGKVDFSVGVIRDGRLQILRGPLLGMEKYICHIDRHKKKATLEMLLFGEKKRFFAGLEIIART